MKAVCGTCSRKALSLKAALTIAWQSSKLPYSHNGDEGKESGGGDRVIRTNKRIRGAKADVGTGGAY
jgi:hypothetical protein